MHPAPASPSPENVRDALDRNHGSPPFSSAARQRQFLSYVVEALYRRRNDAESINRAFDDTLWLRRAHSIGHERQQLKLLTHARVVNSLAWQCHAQRSTDPPLAHAS
jgi:hypothetical protein